MQGLLLVDKPADWTSFDVVNYVRKIVANVEGKKPKQVKVGHTGTLDPFASGLLILLIGKDFTKKAGDYAKLDKTYEVTATLGFTSSTGDPEGEIVPVSAKEPSQPELQAVAQKFSGTIMQTPPAFSAIKVDGQRAYKLARAGKEVKIEPRQITINRLKVTNYSYPEVKFVADVSSGTYIRTLVEDIGAELGTGAYTSELRRTKISEFAVSRAVQTDQITPESLPTYLKKRNSLSERTHFV